MNQQPIISPDFYWYAFESSDSDKKIFEIILDGNKSEAKVNSEVIGSVSDSY